LLSRFIKNAGSYRLAWRGKSVDPTVFYKIGIALVVVGVIVVVAAIILLSNGNVKKGKVHGAGVIMIGPIPIIFGTDKKSVKFVLVIGLALTIVVLIITIYYLLMR
jgi:uncharacterized protein (TIGR00304 family)